MRKIKSGIYPTMITPFTGNNEIDEDALCRLVQWYEKKGCHGIFAACQSSEIFFMTPQECRKMVEITKRESMKLSIQSDQPPMTIVASGHTAEDIGRQAEELIMMYEAGADAVVLITNRLDISKKGEDIWLKELFQLLHRLPDYIPLGIYECPTPYKRLLTTKMLEEIKESDRFVFFKDTCCDPLLLKQRSEFLRGSSLKLFNANAQTLLMSLKSGADGYCGIMANFHPELYVWLYENYQTETENSEYLSDILSLSAFSEALAYPVTAKYYLSHFENVSMELFCRSCSPLHFGEYDKLVMHQLQQLNQKLALNYL